MEITNNSIIKYEKFDSISGVYMCIDGVHCFIVNEDDTPKVKAETFQKLYSAMREKKPMILKKEMI